jgi:hypothetical protein
MRAERKHFHTPRCIAWHRAKHVPRASRRVCEAARVLSDGVYDAIVIDVETIDDALAIDLAITSGAHKGDVVRVRRAARKDANSLDFLGLPATITVTDGQPSLAFE